MGCTYASISSDVRASRGGGIRLVYHRVEEKRIRAPCFEQIEILSARNREKEVRLLLYFSPGSSSAARCDFRGYFCFSVPRDFSKRQAKVSREGKKKKEHSILERCVFFFEFTSVTSLAMRKLPRIANSAYTRSDLLRRTVFAHFLSNSPTLFYSRN